MKVFWVVVLPFLGAVCGDQTGSSYASLPYEDEIHPNNHINYHQSPDYNYDYDDYSGGKKGFDFGRIMKAPFKALKGAGDYMMGMFDDVKGKFMELNGSFLRAKGNFLEAKGENMLRHVYSSRAQGNFYPLDSYHPTYHHPRQPYNPNPGRVVPYGMHASLGHDHDNQYQDAHNTVEHDIHAKSGNHGGHHDTQGHVAQGHANFNSNVPKQTNHRRQFVEQRSARSFSEPWRTQRSYGGPGPIIDDLRPIPVPVPISVYPSRLIFPSLADFHGGGGYH